MPCVTIILKLQSVLYFAYTLQWVRIQFTTLTHVMYIYIVKSIYDDGAVWGRWGVIIANKQVEKLQDYMPLNDDVGIAGWQQHSRYNFCISNGQRF